MSDFDPRDVARLLALCLEPKLLDGDHPIDDLLNSTHDAQRVIDHFGMSGDWRDRHYELTTVGRKVIFGLLEHYRPDTRLPGPETVAQLRRRLAAAEELAGALRHYADCAMRNQASAATVNAQADARRAHQKWEDTILAPVHEPAVERLTIARERIDVDQWRWSLLLDRERVASAVVASTVPPDSAMTLLFRSLIEGRPA